MKRLSNGILKRIFFISIIVIVFINNFVWIEINSELHSFLHEKALKYSEILNDVYEGIQDSTINSDSAKILAVVKTSKLLSVQMAVLNKNGNLIYPTNYSLNPNNYPTKISYLHLPEIQQAMEEGNGNNLRFSNKLKKEIYFFSSEIRKNGKIDGFFHLSVSTFEYNKHLFFAKLMIILVDLILLLMMFFIFLNVKKYISKQTKLLIEEVKNSVVGDEVHPLKYHNLDEFNQISLQHNHIINLLNEKNLKAVKKEKQLLDLLNSLSEGIAAFDKKGKLVFSNSKFKNIINPKQTQKLEPTVFDLIDFPPLITDINKFQTHGNEVHARVKYWNEHIIEYTIIPLTLDDKKNGMILIFRDVTEVARLEQIRTDFVANVSHEFKTPLTSIRGYTETLLDGKRDENVLNKFLSKILKQTLYLENMVSDLLKLSRIEKKEVYQISEIEITPILTEISEEFRQKVEESGYKFIFDNSISQNVFVNGNKALISTIISNFLLNAIQYSKQNGKITLHSFVEHEFVQIEVIDEGIGIAEEEIERIFERFYRTKDAKDMFSTGSGLGLSIVKNSIELLGGKFGVESKKNVGSKFWISLEKNNHCSSL